MRDNISTRTVYRGKFWNLKIFKGFRLLYIIRYSGVDVVNLTSSWTDGLAFAALIHRHRPDLIDFNELDKAKPIHNMQYAFNVAEDKLQVASLLEAEGWSTSIGFVTQNIIYKK